MKEESKAWGLVLDPDGAEPRYEQQRRKRSFRLVKKGTGGYEITGFAPDVEGAAMRTLLDAYLSPRTKDAAPGTLFDAEPSNSDRSADGATQETRSRDQLAFDALAHVLSLHAASAAAPSTGGAAPTLLITTTLTALDHHLRGCESNEAHGPSAKAEVGPNGRGPTLQGPGECNQRGLDLSGSSWEAGSPGQGAWPRGFADLPLNRLGVPDPEALVDLRFARVGGDGTPVPLSAVMHLLCDAALQVMLTDPEGVPLKLGRAQRLFTKDQRRVLAARDHHCRAPGCGIPAQWCEVHHVVPWQDGGLTDVTNAVLLCSFHHHEIDRGRLRVEHHPGADVRFGQRYSVEPTWAPPSAARCRPA